MTDVEMNMVGELEGTGEESVTLPVSRNHLTFV